MHAFGWSRERAMACFKAQTAKTDQDIVNEIERLCSLAGMLVSEAMGPPSTRWLGRSMRPSFFVSTCSMSPGDKPARQST